MKTSRCIGAALVAGFCIDAIASPVGRWEGNSFVAGQQFPLIIEIKADEGGELRAAMSLPTVSLFDEAFESVTVDGDRVVLHLANPDLGTGEVAGVMDDWLWTGDVNIAQDSGLVFTGGFSLARVVDVGMAALESCVGQFDVEGFGLVEITVEESAGGTHLRAFSETVGGATTMFPIGEDHFVMGLDPQDDTPVGGEVVFARDGTGAVTRFTLLRNGAEMPATRRVVTFEIDATRIDALVESAMGTNDIPSAVVGVVRGDDLVYAKAYGYADIESGRAATLDTMYQVGSITKTFTATVVAQQREEGLLSLDDTIEEFLPEGRTLGGLTAEERAGITLERLLSHTSGMQRTPFNRPRSTKKSRAYEVDDLYLGITHLQLLYPPGAGWSYSNLGFGLLGHASSRIDGVTYQEMLNARILGPLGMPNTRVALSDDDLERFATHYWAEDDPRVARPRWDFGEIAGNGGLVSTVGDMAKWASAQLAAQKGRDSAISTTAMRDAHKPRAYYNGPLHSIGLSWFLDFSPEQGLIISHGGEVDGHGAQLSIAPAHDVAIILLTNIGGGATGALGGALISDVIDQARAQVRPTVDDAERAYFANSWGDAAWAYGGLRRANPSNGQAAYRYAHAMYNLRRFEESLDAFRQAAEHDYFPEQSIYSAASIHAIRGETSLAIEALGEAIELGFNDLQLVTTDPDLDSIRDHPEFAGLLEALGTDGD